MKFPEEFPIDLELKIYSYIKYEINSNLLKEIKDYHRKNTKEYSEKLLDSDSEEFWDEYIDFSNIDEEKIYKKYVYSNKKIYNYKTKKLIKIKINTV